MNKRIKELKAKATLPAQKDGYTSWVFNEEKFAELIVRECAQIAWSYTPDNDEEMNYGLLIKDKILLHFGVEE